MSVAPPEEVVSGSPAPLLCSLVVHDWASVTAAGMGAARTLAATINPDSLSAKVLKQVDDQVVVALQVFHAINNNGANNLIDSDHWGLVAASRSVGRRRVHDSVAKYRVNGAWTTSPNIIPHCSLHSLPGLLSQALRLHGPNLGAGGMAGREGEAISAALSLLHGERLPGVWVVLTGWEHETLETDSGRCQAAVLGLVRARPGLPCLSFLPGRSGRSLNTFTLESLIDSIRHGSESIWNLGGATATLGNFTTSREAAA